MSRIRPIILVVSLGALTAFGQPKVSKPTHAKSTRKDAPPNPINPVCANNWQNEGSAKGRKMGSFASVDFYVFGSHQDGVAILDRGKLIACDQINDQALETSLAAKIAVVVHGIHHDMATIYGRNSKGRIVICDYPSLDHHLRVGAINDNTVVFTEIGMNHDLSRQVCWDVTQFHKSVIKGPKCDKPVPMLSDVGKDGDNSSSPRIIAGRP